MIQDGDTLMRYVIYSDYSDASSFSVSHFFVRPVNFNFNVFTS